MYEFNLEKMKVIGRECILVNGGVDISKKPVWIEGPHILQKDGWYYLIAAEGGTAEWHSEVVFRSKNVEGPYIPYEKNPILTQRHLDPNRKFPITSTGHADFVQTESGDWWSVFLGCRPYEDGYYNIGRETFLAPVKWIEGWPVINPGYEEVQYYYPYPIQMAQQAVDHPYSGNFTIRDDFTSETLSPDWVFLRTPRETWYDGNCEKDFLSLKVRPETCSGTGNPSFLGRRQQHHQGYASTAMKFLPSGENEKAGLLVFHNENHFYFLCKSVVNGEPVVQLFSSGSDSEVKLLASQKLHGNRIKNTLQLKIEAHKDTYSFLYAESPDQWILLKDMVDGKFLSTRTAGGFVGSMYALYATSTGKPSTTTALFDWFEYQGNDDVYK
jgi:alpha-N-arabinofuranosidase